MKVALIGGGGVRTPAVLYALARRWAHVPIAEVALYDIDSRRQEMMALVAARMLEGTDAGFRVIAAREPAAAIDGASFVLVSIRVGGQPARAADERIALDHGCIGQETTGPAGFAYALRSIPVVEQYALMMGRLAPRAWLINFTNPSGLVTQALSSRSPVPIVGVCDSPQEIARRIADAAHVGEEEIDWRYSGVNHLGWVTSARVRGQEILPALIADDAALDRLTKDGLIPPNLVRHLGTVPNEYCYYYYYRRQALQRQQAARELRGELLARLEQQLGEEMAQLDPSDADAVIACYGRYFKQREETYLEAERQGLRRLPEQSHRDLILGGGQGYIDTAMKVIAGLCGLGPQRAALNVSNYGQIVPGMDDDDIVETSCEITAEGILPLPGPELARESLSLLRTLKAYERLASEAALTGSRRLAIRALTHHPLVASFPLAEKLVDAYLDRHRDYLPRFRQVRS
jgi:6-phospho-beta-glucosidase